MLVDINLLPVKEKERSRLLIAALTILSAAVLLWVVLLTLSNNFTKETEILEGQLVSLQASQEEIRSELQQSESGDEKKLLASTVGWAEEYQFDIVPLLRELIYLLPKRGFFQAFDFTSPNLATVTVEFDTKPDSAYYYTRLKSSPSVSEINLDSVTIEEAIVSTEVLPRYLATYSIQFVDERIPAKGTVETTDEAVETPSLEEGDAADD